MEATEAIITLALAQEHAERSGNGAPGEPKSSRRAKLAAVLFVVVALPLSGVSLRLRSSPPRPRLLRSSLLPASVLTGALNGKEPPDWLGRTLP